MLVEWLHRRCLCGRELRYRPWEVDLAAGMINTCMDSKEHKAIMARHIGVIEPLNVETLINAIEINGAATKAKPFKIRA